MSILKIFTYYVPPTIGSTINRRLEQPIAETNLSHRSWRRETRTKDASPKKDLDAMDFDFSKKKILYDKEVSVKKQYFMFGPLCGTCIYGIKEIKF